MNWNKLYKLDTLLPGSSIFWRTRMIYNCKGCLQVLYFCPIFHSISNMPNKSKWQLVCPDFSFFSFIEKSRGVESGGNTTMQKIVLVIRWAYLVQCVQNALWISQKPLTNFYGKHCSSISVKILTDARRSSEKNIMV